MKIAILVPTFSKFSGITGWLSSKQDMTQGCVDYARNYDWDKITDTVEDTYEQVISG